MNDPGTAVDETDGLGSLDPRTFGEAQIDFDAFAGGDECVGFGSAYLKSRSSDSFTAAMKDFIPPIPLAFDECGAIKIHKDVKVPNGGTQGHAGVTFTVTDDATPTPNVVGTGTTDANGDLCIDELVEGTYTVTETVPTGYVAAGANPKTVVVDTTGVGCDDDPYTGETVNFENTPLTDLTVTATAQVQGATNSSISCVNNAAPATKIIDVALSDPASGSATGLLPGTYTCTIFIDP